MAARKKSAKKTKSTAKKSATRKKTTKPAKSAKAPVAKTTETSSGKASKKTRKKSTTKKKPTKRAATKTATKKSVKPAPPKTKSLDSIVKGYEKERVQREGQLTNIKTKIKDLTAKVKAYEKQIVMLRKKQMDTENAICTLHSRRDREVGEALLGIGINLDNAAAAVESANKKKVDKPTPLFDVAEAKPAKEASDDNQSVQSKTEPAKDSK